MKVSYNWLNELCPIELTPDELAERLTLSGAEVERVEKIGTLFTEVVVGKVLAVEPDEKKSNWFWCRVDIGKRIISTLCAAPNVRMGLLTAVMLPGGHPVGVEKKVEIREIGERISEAVLCSEKELGLGDNDRGIIELARECIPGQYLSEVLKLEDAILDIDVTPNRPDLLSHRGVARDISALTGRKMREINISLEASGPPIKESTTIEVLDYNDCPRYCARLIRGVKIAESPLWLRRRLQLCGIKPVNNVVDATNYLLLEIGHPLHAFDYNRLSGGRIIVRKAIPGESIVTIDGDERKLEETMLVIADEEKPVAVAGVMGGLYTEISEDTSIVLLESAYFNPISIRRTSRRLGLSSDASRRFERGADPLAADYALDRTAALIVELAGGAVAKGMIDKCKQNFDKVRAGIRPKRTELLLGYQSSESTIIELLSRLGLELIPGGEEGTLNFQIPSWRPDLNREVDLIEEVARLTGFDKIPATIPVSKITCQRRGDVETARHHLSEICRGVGLDEVITYSFLSPGVFERLGLCSDDPLCQACEITNPVNKEQRLLRTTLIPGLLEIIERNLNQKARQVNIFEIGRVFNLEKDDVKPKERMLFTFTLFYRPDKADWCGKEPVHGFYYLKGILELIVERMKLKGLEFKPVAHPILQPGQGARILIDGQEVGMAGVVADNILANYSLLSPVYLAEMEFDIFPISGGKIPRFQQLIQYPPVRRDMAMVLNESIPYSRVRETIEKHRPELLEGYFLFDLYRGDQISKGKKSFAFSLQYRSPNDTLCETTVKNIHQVFLDNLTEDLGCTFR